MMITLIIKSYFTLLLSIGLGALFVLVIGLYFIFRHTQPAKETNIIPLPEDLSVDLTAIAGDDVMTTQLDLARAYIETGQRQSAKPILETVVKEGSRVQQEEAQRLLASVFSG